MDDPWPADPAPEVLPRAGRAWCTRTRPVAGQKAERLARDELPLELRHRQAAELGRDLVVDHRADRAVELDPEAALGRHRPQEPLRTLLKHEDVLLARLVEGVTVQD